MWLLTGQDELYLGQKRGIIVTYLSAGGDFFLSVNPKELAMFYPGQHSV